MKDQLIFNLNKIYNTKTNLTKKERKEKEKKKSKFILHIHSWKYQDWKNYT